MSLYADSAHSATVPRMTSTSDFAGELGHLPSEVALLEAFFASTAQDLLRIAAPLLAGDFVGPHHAAVFEALVALAREGIAPQPQMVVGRIRSDGRASCFSVDRSVDLVVRELSGSRSLAAWGPGFVRTLIEHADRRRAVVACERILQGCGHLATVDLHELIARETDVIRQPRANPRPASLRVVA